MKAARKRRTDDLGEAQEPESRTGSEVRKRRPTKGKAAKTAAPSKARAGRKSRVDEDRDGATAPVRSVPSGRARDEDEVLGPAAPRRVPRRATAPDGESRVRYQVASVLRISDTLVGKAVQLYDQMFKLGDEDQAEIHLEMGLEYARTGKAAEALRSLRKATELQPDLAEAWIEIARLYLRREAFEAALDALETAQGLVEDGTALRPLLVETLSGLERHEEAMEHVEHMLRRDQEDPDLWFQLGTLNDRLGQHEEAAEAFSQAIELDPRNVVYHQSLGFSLESAGHRTEAIKCFKRALVLEGPSR